VTTKRPDLICLADVKSLPVPWIWEGYLAFGMLAMLSGDPDAGKTFIALAIAADLSTGRIPVVGKACDPISTLYLSTENAAEYVIKPRFDAQGGNPGRFHLLRGSIEGDDDSAKKSGITLKDISVLESALKETGAKLVVIDPLQSYLGAEVDAHRSNETRPVMDGLINLAERTNTCVLIVRHLSKASGGRAIHRGLGSIDLTGAVRTEMIAGGPANDPNNRAVIQIKNNVGKRAPSLGYEIVEDGASARLVWLDETQLTANDLLEADVQEQGRSDIDLAIEFLKDELANGPKRQTELVESGGFSGRTLQRAFQRIEGKRSRECERGSVLWSLPDHSRQNDHTRQLSMLTPMQELSPMPTDPKTLERCPG